MLKIYTSIFSKIWICLLFAGGIIFATSQIFYGSIVALIANITIFCVVYSVLLWYWGLDKEEKKSIPVLNRFVK